MGGTKNSANYDSFLIDGSVDVKAPRFGELPLNEANLNLDHSDFLSVKIAWQYSHSILIVDGANDEVGAAFE